MVSGSAVVEVSSDQVAAPDVVWWGLRWWLLSDGMGIFCVGCSYYSGEGVGGGTRGKMCRCGDVGMCGWSPLADVRM